MLRKNIFLIGLLCLLLGTAAFAEDPAIIEIVLDGQTLAFDPAPQVVEGQPMVPMRAFFEALDSRVVWIPETQQVLGYKDNMFIKLQIGSQTAYKNGTASRLVAAPYITEGTTMVPARFIAETFDLSVSWAPEDGIVRLTRRDNSVAYNLYNNYFLKKYYLDDLGVNLSVPPGWDLVEKNLLVDVTNPNPMQIELSRFERTSSMGDLDQIAMRLQRDYLVKLGESARATGLTGRTLQETQARRMTFTVGDGSDRTYKVVYLITSDEYGYVFEATYGENADATYAIDLFDTLAETLHITKLTLNREEEHYVEYLPFFEDGVTLETPAHSNMEVQGSLTLEGTLADDHEVERIGVEVTKNNREVRFMIPIREDHFKGTLHTPFGLGKHNVLVYRVPTQDAVIPEVVIEVNTTTDAAIDPVEEAILPVTPPTIVEERVIPAEDYYLRFSVVNLNADVSPYLIPTESVPSANAEIKGAAKVATVNLTTEYAKGKRLYDLLLNRLEIDPASDASTLGAFREGRADELTVNQIYVAMLRSVDIESRIVALLTDTEEGTDRHYLTQIKINDRWVYSDLVRAVRENDDVTEANYFNVYLAYYTYDRLEILTH